MEFEPSSVSLRLVGRDNPLTSNIDVYIPARRRNNRNEHNPSHYNHNNDDNTMLRAFRDDILNVNDDDDDHDDENNATIGGDAATRHQMLNAKNNADKRSSQTDPSGFMQQLLQQTNVVGPDESQWRKHGAARRLRLLEEDRQKGGRDFKISHKDCSVQRYFQVAHWALEQFHKLYQSGTKLEETYIMGHRIVSFLTDCLPQHPGLYRAPDVQKRAQDELELLTECLEDVALKIDEEACNQFVADFDPALLEDDDDDDELDEAESLESTSKEDNSASSSLERRKETKMVRFEDWVAFPESRKGQTQQQTQQRQQAINSFSSDDEDVFRKSAESPTSDTVGTTGTDSLELLDSSYLDQSHESSANGRELVQDCLSSDHDYDYDNPEVAAFPSHQLQSYRRFPDTVRLDFLEQIAGEEVEFETDSEAADSWAQGDGDSADRAPSSLGVAPTCDPARIAFRNLMNRLPRDSFLLVPRTTSFSFAGNSDMENKLERQLLAEERAEHEIHRNLESDEDSDAPKVFESVQEKLKEGSVSSDSGGLSGDGSVASSQAASMSQMSSNCVLLPSSSSSFASYSTSAASFAETSDSTGDSEATSTSSLSDSPRSALRPFVGPAQFVEPGNYEAPDDELEEDNKFWERDDWITFDKAPVNFFSSSKA